MGVLEAAIDPGPRLGADEVDRLLDRRRGNAGIDGDLDDLEDRAIGGRLVVALVARNDPGLVDLDIVYTNRSTR